MSNNFNSKKDNREGNSNTAYEMGVAGNQNNLDNLQLSDQQVINSVPNYMQGFRNPWYHDGQSSSTYPSFQNSPQSPPKSQGQNLTLLQKGQKRLSFANQLATTYEYDARRNSNGPPFILPPTRADNPFNQYYSNQEVNFGGWGPDRRMSTAADGMYSDTKAYESIQTPAGGEVDGDAFLPYGVAQALNYNRRSSVAAGHLGDRNHMANNYNYQQIKPQRSTSVVRYYQYQQALEQRARTSARTSAPKAKRIYSKYDLRPRTNQQPKYRRSSANSIHISPANALSIYLTETYSICQPKTFQYSKSTNPKRVLTKPSEPKFNNGCDNENSDYILYVNDILGSEEGRKYIVLDLLGSGTFGQVVKCQNLSNNSFCAVKVIKSKPAYMNQSLTEVKLLEHLNANSDGRRFTRLLDTFMHKEHLCLVFELLASNLYELIKQNQFQGLNLKLVRSFTKQLLEALADLKTFQMIHCDLKPENILLCQPDKPDIKVIDFGSACFNMQTVYSYIQSRFYRSPEVILGLPYTESIDMWSLGCIVAELYLGLPLFPGTSEYNQIWKIVDMLGNPPRYMIEVGRNSSSFFKRVASISADEKPHYVIKPLHEFIQTSKKDSSKKEQPNKNYFKHRSLKDIIMNYKLPSKKMTKSMIEKECKERLLLFDFLQSVLNLNPLERLNPQQALRHPFIVGSPDNISTSVNY